MVGQGPRFDVAEPHFLGQTASMKTHQLRTLLENHGYQIVGRHDGFSEFLVCRADERWTGRGLDEDSALADAARQMFPSALAWALLERAQPEATEGVDEEAPAGAVEAPAGAVDVEPVQPVDEPTEASAPADGAAPDAPNAPETVCSTALHTSADPASTLIPEAAPPRAAEPQVRLPDQRLRAAAPDPVAPALERVTEVLEELAETTDLALFAPEQMRLQLLAWMATARDAQDRAGHHDVEQLTTRVAARLGEIARTFWPGRVAALSRASVPSEAFGDPTLRDWHMVAAQAEQRLAVSAMGTDTYGWRDGARLDPPPSAPRVHLKEVRRLITGWLGDLELLNHPDSASARDLLERAPASTSELHRAAALLRWCRPVADDPAQWGRLAGWLRWISLKRRDDLELTRLLDPAFIPPRAWAEMAGFDLRRPEPVVQTPAPPAVEAGAGPLLAWLRDHARDLSQAELLAALSDHQATVSTLDVDQQLVGADLRSLRTKIKKLVQRGFEPLTGKVPPPAPRPAPQPAEAPPEAAPVGAIGHIGPVAEARARVEGKRTLVVSNREDPHLKRHLSEGLGIRITDWAQVDKPAAAAAKATAIRQGSYDLVIMATGFISHSDEPAIREACLAASIPYVRAGKCRLVGCAIAILEHGVGNVRKTA